MHSLTPLQLGETKSKEALPHLEKFLNSDTRNEVRLAASATSKIAEHHPNECLALVKAMTSALKRHDGQARQYILKALNKLHLNDEHNELHAFLLKITNLDPKEYNRAAAQKVLHNSYQGSSILTSPIKNNELSTRKPPPIKLTGEQRKVLTLPLKGAIKIRGCAGSGKTTVAIFRVKQLVASGDDFFRDTAIGIFSYTKSLVAYIDEILDQAASNPKIVVSTLHSWIYQFMKPHGVWELHTPVKGKQGEESLDIARATLLVQNPSRQILSKEIAFYKDEISWIKGKMITSLDAYHDAKRIGRGTQDRVTQDDKNLLWDLYVAYEEYMRSQGLIDYDDYIIIALSLIDNLETFPPPFSHIVVDEGQDFSALHFTLIKKLVSTETESITIIADAAQQIYKSGFTWSSIGINIQGNRSITLKRNYRNTEQIAKLALDLTDHESKKEEFTEHELPSRQGELPVLHESSNRCDMHDYLLLILSQLNSTDESVVILHRNRRPINQIDSLLKEQSYFPVKIQDKGSQISSSGVYLCTMSSIKGLEFDHVLILGLDEDLIPLPAGFNSAEDDLHISTERKLLYTCITRARKTLHMFTSGAPCRYIAEFKPQNFIRS